MSYEYYSQYLDITPEEYAQCEEIASSFSVVGLGYEIEWFLNQVHRNKHPLIDNLSWFHPANLRKNFRLESPKVSEDEFLKYLLQSGARYW